MTSSSSSKRRGGKRKSRREGQWSILSIQDAFKIKFGIGDLFKFVVRDVLQVGSKSPGDRNKTINSHNSSTSASNNRTGDRPDGRFMTTRLTEEEKEQLRSDMQESDAIYADKLLMMIDPQTQKEAR